MKCKASALYSKSCQDRQRQNTGKAALSPCPGNDAAANKNCRKRQKSRRRQSDSSQLSENVYTAKDGCRAPHGDQ